MPAHSQLLFVLLVFLSISFSNGTQLILVNNCNESVWPGLLGGAGQPSPEDGGFHLSTGEEAVLKVPDGWSGRIWGRQGCSFDTNGKGSCDTGDCAGMLHCKGMGGTPPATVVEMTLGTQKSPLHYYDVSLVDGFNLPVAMIPVGGGIGCGVAACEEDLNVCCPSMLEVKRGERVVGCKSACFALKSDKYCCTGDYASPQSCKPTLYSNLFKAICPGAYSFAYDDSSSLRTMVFLPTEIQMKMKSASPGSLPFAETNHGIAEDVLQRMKAAAAAFFELPPEEKKMYSMASNDLQGYGQAYVVSEQQKLDWSDILFLMTLPIKDRKLNYWPTRVTDFMEAVDAYSTEINRVANELFANLSLMMNMGKETLQRLHGEMKQAIRLNYYPICSRPELVLGVSPHSDCSTMSLLLQDDEVSALQIQHEGHWVPIEPIPRALVVNVGDIFEAWTNGMYKSIEHRAITNKKKARMSIATFLLPDPEVEIGPLDEMVGDHRPRKYKKFKYLDYIRYTLDRKMEGKSHTQFMKLENE